MKTLLLFTLISFSLFAHEEKLEEINVIEKEDSQGLVDFVPSARKLKGEELSRSRATSIGDTLSGQAGVQSTSFGPNASRPVVRGLDGDRLKVLQNGLGTVDASTQSLDHAIPIDTLTVDSVEFARGPMSLLYGTSPVGGVVNIITNRIHYQYEEGFFSKAMLQGESVNRGLSSALHLNYGADKWMFHVDGSTRNLGDVSVPGYARSAWLRNQTAVKGTKDKISNSANRQDNVAIAASRIYERGYYGFSFNHYNSLYGSVAEPHVAIDMTQNRYEFHSEYRPESGPIRKWKLKSAQSDYGHRELDAGVTGTRFQNSGNETRLEGTNKGGEWDGVSGIQTQLSSFKSEGTEAFLPSSENSRVSLFTFQQLSIGKNAYRFAGRVESDSIRKRSSSTFGGGDRKGYAALSGSLGHCYDFSKTDTLETTLSYTERAPTAQELYSNGEHVATGSFERGDSTLRKERSTSGEVSFTSRNDRNQFKGSAYTQMYKDFISLTPTGAVVSGLPEYGYEHVDALFYGIDIDNKNELSRNQGGSLFLVNKFDFVRAKNTDNGHNLPRISPPRVSAGLEFQTDDWSFDGETQFVSDQTKTAPEERRTESFFMTNVGTTYRLVGNLSSLELFARIRNVFDVEARNHVSFLKDVAPMPGRNLIIGAQFQF